MMIVPSNCVEQEQAFLLREHFRLTGLMGWIGFMGWTGLMGWKRYMLLSMSSDLSEVDISGEGGMHLIIQLVFKAMNARPERAKLQEITCSALSILRAPAPLPSRAPHPLNYAYATPHTIKRFPVRRSKFSTRS